MEHLRLIVALESASRVRLLEDLPALPPDAIGIRLRALRSALSR